MSNFLLGAAAAIMTSAVATVSPAATTPAATTPVPTTVSSAPTTPARAAAWGSPAEAVYYASAYGAICDGTLRRIGESGSVDGDAIQAAIDAAEANPAGGTVVIPAGKCMLAEDLVVAQGAPVTIVGTLSAGGGLASTLTDSVNPPYRGGDFEIGADHTTVADLVLDQHAYGGAAIVGANYTTFEDMTILGGPGFFALYFHALASGAKAQGNQLVDDTVSSLIDRTVAGKGPPCDDGLSWSDQTGSAIKGLDFTGTRLALYRDSDTTVSGYTYHPGPQSCDLDGYFITQPSSGITLDGLTMYGSAGVVGNGGATNGAITSTTIEAEAVEPPTAGTGFTLAGPSHGLIVRNVNGLVVEDSNFDSGNLSNSSIDFEPTTSAQAVSVDNTTVVRVSFSAQAPKGSSTLGSVDQAVFSGDEFPAFAWPNPNLDETFVNTNATPASFSVVGGSFSNYDPGDAAHQGFFKGSNTSYTVTGLAGY
jgi:hypothetical protein